IDTKKGIAFEFAYFPEEGRRYLYAVIVFRVDGDLCPDGNKPDPQHWREIAPYSLNPPDRSTQLIFPRAGVPARLLWQHNHLHNERQQHARLMKNLYNAQNAFGRGFER